MLRAVVVLLALAVTPVRADPPPAIACSEGAFGPRHCIRADRFAADLCHQIEAEARLHGLPPGFLARLLWQESRFDPGAVSPKRAMGIAQFIASTAQLRGLADPFNPAEAIEKSAHYLGEMSGRYGNVGLVAIGYNGGEARVERFMARSGGLARETVNYVRIITGLRAETWRDGSPEDVTFVLDDAVPFQTACVTMAPARRISPLATPEPPVSPWGVQVGFGLDEGAARASYDRLTRGCRSEAPAARLEFVRVEGRGPGRRSLVAARIGAASRSEAVALCRAIARAGCICRAFRN